MRLLLTRFSADGLTKSNLFTLFDLETQESPFCDPYDGLGLDRYNATGAVYSGNWLCIAVNKIKDDRSLLLLLNYLSLETRIIELSFSFKLYDLVSVFPGQLYVCSEGTHSLNNISFSPETGEFKSDSLHFKLPDYQDGFVSLCSHQMRWYGTISDSVIELSNNRIIHAALINPHHVFFNSHERLCFVEANKFYAGDDVFYFDGAIGSVYEDNRKAGYWFFVKNKFVFRYYDGSQDYSPPIVLNGPSVFKILELRGGLHEAF